MGEIINMGDAPTRKDDQITTGLSALVWSCNACGNTTFQLLQGGSVRCACCNLMSTELAHFRPDGKDG